MFTTDLQSILQQVQTINPIQYAKTRNYLDGAVTKLSPYITHGALSLPQIKDEVLHKYSQKESEKFIQELAWREYFRRVWEAKDEQILQDLRFTQEPVQSMQVPTALTTASTGITVIDTAIQELISTGYMHNHARMWIASIACNIANVHWFAASKWLYYHLYDGDIASNSLSWQWVAGAFASKKYYANQENINTYSHSTQNGTFLDTSYEKLPTMSVPELLQGTSELQLQTTLPSTAKPVITSEDIVQVYHPFTLDPQWKVPGATKKIVLFEPSHFTKYPVSQSRLTFIQKLAHNVLPNVELVQSEFVDLPAAKYFAKWHPCNQNWQASFIQPEYLFPEVTGYYKNFYSYWKQCQNTLKK